MPRPENTEDNSAPPKLTIDWDLYQDFLEDTDLTDDQKREFIETLWSIMVSFVDLGFGIHPLQQACGQMDEMCTADSSSVIESEDHNKETVLEPAVHNRGERTES